MEKSHNPNSKMTKSQENVLKHFSPHIQKEFMELFVHKDKIVQILKNNDSEKELFKNSPHEFFVKHKMNMPPYIEKRLKLFNLEAIKKEEKIVLPNGQVISFNSKINIVIEE